MKTEAKPLRAIGDFPSVGAQNFSYAVRHAAPAVMSFEPAARRVEVLSILSEVVRGEEILDDDAMYALGLAYEEIRKPIGNEDVRIAALCLVYNVAREFDGMEGHTARIAEDILRRTVVQSHGKVAESAGQLLEWLETPSPDPEHPRYESLLLAAA